MGRTMTAEQETAWIKIGTNFSSTDTYWPAKMSRELCAELHAEREVSRKLAEALLSLKNEASGFLELSRNGGRPGYTNEQCLAMRIQEAITAHAEYRESKT